MKSQELKRNLIFINLATPLTNLKHSHVRPIKKNRRHNSGKAKEAFSSLGLSIKCTLMLRYTFETFPLFVSFF